MGEDAEKKTAVEVVEKKKRGRKPGQKASRGKGRPLTQSDIVEVLTMRQAAVPSSTIAAHLDVHVSSVNRCIERFSNVFKTLPEIRDYREYRADILQALQLQTLKSLAQEDKHEKASVNQLAYSFEVLHKAERLEVGKSTENRALSFVKVDDDKDR